MPRVQLQRRELRSVTLSCELLRAPQLKVPASSSRRKQQNVRKWIVRSMKNGDLFCAAIATMVGFIGSSPYVDILHSDLSVFVAWNNCRYLGRSKAVVTASILLRRTTNLMND